MDYLKPNGAIGFYHPDWVIVRANEAGEVNWIIETTGRVGEGTPAKDAAMRDWCERVSEQTQRIWRCERINQTEFDPRRVEALADIVKPSEPGLTVFEVDATAPERR